MHEAAELLPPSENFPVIGSTFKGKSDYKVIKLLGKGGFGAVYQVLSSENKQMYAVKCESYDHPRKVLLMDCLVLRGAELLQSPHFCKIHDVGKVEGKFRFIVITLIGLSLHSLRTLQPDKRFSIGTALRLGQQCLEALEVFVKTHCILTDNEERIDKRSPFQLIRKFRESDRLIPRKVAPFRGTPRYASLNSHRKKEQSPKDDIESWFYMMVEWTGGKLPWRKLKPTEKDKILISKEEARKPEGKTQLLRNCPEPHYRMMMDYIDSLKYTSIPDYGYIYFLLKHIAKVYHIRPDKPLDYDPEHPYKGPETPLSCLPKGVQISYNNEERDRSAIKKLYH